MLETIKQNKRVYGIVMLVLALISIGIVSSRLFSVLAFALAFVAVLLLKPGDAYSILFALMPFANIFKLEPNAMSLFTVLEIVVVLVGLLKAKKIRVPFLASLFVLFAYMVLFSWGHFDVLTIVKVLNGFLLIYCATIHIKKEDIRNITYLLSASTSIMLLLCQVPGYFKYVVPYLTDMNYYVNNNGTASNVLRNSGFLGDPNYCAVLIIVVLALLCVLYYYKHIGMEFWIFSALLLPLGFMTYSKSYFLCAAVLLMFLFVFVLIPKHMKWALVALLGVIILAYFALSGKIEVFNMILARFKGGVGFTTGRTELNQQYLTYIFDDMKVALFGEGISVDRYDGARNNVHNIYIELLFKMGIVGAVVYIVSLCLAFGKGILKISWKRKFADYMPAMFVAVMFAFLAGVLNYAMPFYLVIAYVALNYNFIPLREEMETRS